MMALTPKQKRFVAEYLVDLNATAAARRAGYSAKTADRIGPELLGKTCVSEAIQQAIREREKRTEITQDMVLRETAKLAFFDIRKMFDKDGKPLDIPKLDADTAAALVGLDVQDVADNDGDYVGFVKKYKMADKLKALELLGKHLGAWEPKDDGPKDEVVEDDLSRSLRELGEGLESDD
ncbi:MAG: terminase small subunit [Oscillospiraceae bacterium]|nr:terminase small subunit [Oscillospiraceae bacterium]